MNKFNFLFNSVQKTSGEKSLYLEEQNVTFRIEGMKNVFYAQLEV